MRIMMVAEADRSPPAASPATALQILLRLVRESIEYGKYYLRVKLARLQLTLATAILVIALVLAGGLAGLAMVITASVLLVRGVAELLTEFLGGHEWAGDILTGVLILAGILAGTYLGVKGATRGLRSGFAATLESLRREQRERFGTDVRERSGEDVENHAAV